MCSTELKEETCPTKKRELYSVDLAMGCGRREACMKVGMQFQGHEESKRQKCEDTGKIVLCAVEKGGGGGGGHFIDIF